MKTLRFGALVAGLLLVAMLPMAVSAQGPVTVATLTPAGSPYIDNQVHSIQPSTSVWVRFDYLLSDTGKPRTTTITLLYGNKSGVGFEVYEPQDMNAYWEKDLAPIIGRGMPEMIPCATGWCAGDSLTWSGSLGATGTYHVRITNYNPFATTFLLSIDGKGVLLAQPIAVTGTSATAQTVTTDDPNRAAVLDGKQQLIPAKSAMWFTFTYKTDYENPPVKLLRLVYGNQSGLRFEVFSPEILGNWWENEPIGIGTPEKTPCSTGMCNTDHLTWSGGFGATGTYYVRIINNGDVAMNALLVLE